jgi:hypothetical protein
VGLFTAAAGAFRFFSKVSHANTAIHTARGYQLSFYRHV